MGDEPERTFKEKMLFYTTAFFILLGTFSMFAFLFLVPFVIEPAFTTIFMQFEETPALCETFETETYYGAKNCSWASCREGCTKDIYQCTQIRVNYRLNLYNYTDEFNFTEYHINLRESEKEVPPVKRTDRYERAIRDYEYDAALGVDMANVGVLDEMSPRTAGIGSGVGHGIGIGVGADGSSSAGDKSNSNSNSNSNDGGGGGAVLQVKHLDFGDENGGNGYLIEGDGGFGPGSGGDGVVSSMDFSGTLVNGGRQPFDEISELNEGLERNLSSFYFYMGARLFPNVKGCGYPPMLNCTIWLKRYTRIGMKFPCYYSKVDPSLVISDLDYWQNTLNLVYSMAIPIPSFIISIIYLTYAYFKIYNEDEESAPLDKNAEDMDIDDDGVVDESDAAVLPDNEAGSQVINVDSTTGDSCIDGMLPNGGGPLAMGMTASASLGGGSVTTPGQLHQQQQQQLQQQQQQPLYMNKQQQQQQQQSSPGASQMTPNSEINSFGHQLKVQMADELSRDSLENGMISTSNSVQGNLSKTMTTSISTPPGPTAAV